MNLNNKCEMVSIRAAVSHDTRRNFEAELRGVVFCHDTRLRTFRKHWINQSFPGIVE